MGASGTGQGSPRRAMAAGRATCEHCDGAVSPPPRVLDGIGAGGSSDRYVGRAGAWRPVPTAAHRTLSSTPAFSQSVGPAHHGALRRCLCDVVTVLVHCLSVRWSDGVRPARLRRCHALLTAWQTPLSRAPGTAVSDETYARLEDSPAVRCGLWSGVACHRAHAYVSVAISMMRCAHR